MSYYSLFAKTPTPIPKPPDGVVAVNADLANTPNLPAKIETVNAIAGIEYTTLITIENPVYPLGYKLIDSNGTVLVDAEIAEDGSLIRDVQGNVQISDQSVGSIDFGIYPLFAEGTLTTELAGGGTVSAFTIYVQ